MIDFGIVKPGTTLYVPFATYDSNDPSASVTLTGLATTDIEIYKNGSVTQRSSDSGYALLDTDGIDVDGVTGIHGFSIDLADNTDAGFYAAGAQYTVVVASVTVDAATINFIACTFRIGYPDADLNTTIATLASQTSFTLTAGPAEDDALNGCVVCIHDVASAVQRGYAVIQDYTGSTKTVTLTAATTFTVAATDNISIYPPSNAQWGGTVAYSTTRGLAGTALPNAAADAAGGLPISDAGGLDLDAVGANVAAVLLDTGTDGVVVAAGSKSGYALSSTGMDAVTLPAGIITATSIATDAITAAKIAADAIGASELAADAVAEIQSGLATAAAIAALNDLSDADVWSYATRVLTANTNLNDPTAAAIADAVWDEATAGHVTAGTFGKLGNDLATSVAAILADTAEIGTAGAGLTEAGGTGDHLTAVPWNAAWDAEVESEANDALVAMKLDHLVAVADADDAVDNSIVAKLASATGDWSTFNAATMALEASKTEHDTTQAAVASLNDIDAAAVLDAAIAEPTSLPAWGSMSLRKIAQVLGVDMLNKIDSDADSVDVWNAAEDTILWSHASSDDGTTFTSAKAA